MAAYEVLLLNTAIPQIQAAQTGDTYVVPRAIAFNSGVNVVNNDVTIYGVTVGRGGGAVSTNTVVGAQAQNATNTGGYGTFVGYQAGYSNTSGQNTLVGANAGQYITTGDGNTGVGISTLGYNNGAIATTGGDNSAVGRASLTKLTTGSYNTALGSYALQANTTASNNTAVGYQAGYSNTTGGSHTLVGWKAGYSITSGIQNTLVGLNAGGSLTTGSRNTFIGVSNNNTGECGSLVTTGSNNTILGGYNGNQGGLDIRTANNYIVLSDGDGNPRQIIDYNGTAMIGTSSYINFGGSLHLKSLLSFVPDNTGNAGNRNWAIQINGSQAGALDFVDSSANNTWPNNAYRVAFTPYGINLGASTNTSGMGITFPATQVASGNANTLDDYEEGTWTPTITSDATSPTLSYLQQTGRYIKIGRLVKLSWYIQVNTVTSQGTGNLRVGGIPSFSADTNEESPGSFWSSGAIQGGASVPYKLSCREQTGSLLILDTTNGNLFPTGGISTSSYLIGQLVYITTA